jgi:hypothetical protein
VASVLRFTNVLPIDGKPVFHILNLVITHDTPKTTERLDTRASGDVK